MDKYFSLGDTGGGSLSPSFDTSHFGELELLGTVMQFKESRQNFWNLIGPGGTVTGRVVIQNGTIFIGACDSNFYALSMDGKEKWRFTTKGVVLEGGVAY